MLSWWLGAAKISPQDSKVSFISIIKTTKFYIYKPIRLSAKKEITSEVKSQNVKVFDVLKNFLFSLQMSFVPVCTSKLGLAKLALLIIILTYLYLLITYTYLLILTYTLQMSFVTVLHLKIGISKVGATYNFRDSRPDPQSIIFSH